MTSISIREAGVRSGLPETELRMKGQLGYFQIIEGGSDTRIDQDSFDQYLANQQPPIQEQQEIVVKRTNGEKMITKLTEITPEMAERCLSRNPQNRTLDMDRVRRYAEEMRRGRWQTTHQGIAFDENGNLIDGQHRLKAIALSGTTVSLNITKGVLREFCPVIDIGRGKSLSNQAQMLGRPERTEHSAIARVIEFGPERTVRITRQDEMDLIKKYWDGVNFALSISNGTTKMYSTIRAVIARAYYTEDHERLKEFVEVFKTEYEGKPENRAAITLKKYLRKLPYSLAPLYRVDIYQKSEVAVRAFLEYRPLTALKNPERELFLLPEEIAPCQN